ncbi:Tex family protein [Desulfovibrio subterraneus]|uniref:RNA-binding transcriptional accessory protein n=1 Tax=Desulfovibrio subterraneus TaxID=2718620 RepID=A0A7J0BHY5_9BACT|nr:Tex family protein [Desulfovibrio subterraneus]GFM33363.1 RNA-binding transcriptional accessory protein [Desulfovibrio subterraneus]
MTTFATRIAKELSLSAAKVEAVIALLDDSATIPFIARYRKEVTGGMDEVAIAAIRDRNEQLGELEKRRSAITQSLEERELLTPELRKAVDGAETLAALEDIYLPYRPKRRTRAQIARERGLEPLADILWKQDPRDVPQKAAAQFVSPENDVPDTEAALAGARDIVAERISEDTETRKVMRIMFSMRGQLVSSATKTAGEKADEAATFRDYFSWQEPAKAAPGHRILAMMRGEREGMLSLSLRPDEPMALQALKRHFVTGSSPCSRQMDMAAEDCYKRLLAPSMENEARTLLKNRADEEAIAVFAANLRELLLASPLGQKRVLALDPGFRTGAKLVCLDAQGALLHNETIYPVTGGAKVEEAAKRVTALVSKFNIEAIAIGNGTASRETEAFVRSLGLPESVMVVMVNESGASVYSASDVARKEFPNHDVTVRGAVSIGRRLMDPLAELVKIDPKAIGVGQYQHDVDQTALKSSLEDVVVSCVNSVGVELNTASAELLTYVSGLGPTLAANIVAQRTESGPFASRKELLKVKRLGPKAYEQCAGFLRINGAKNPLDASAVHPESYAIVERMAKDQGCTVADLIRDETLRKRIRLDDYVTDTIGLPTLTDIVQELARPGRDPRPEFAPFSFADVHTLADLSTGMELPGIVTNVTKFGAFVDIGVHQDGLVHVSQLSDNFVKDPADVVRVQQRVRVRVVEVDQQRKRIGLTMKGVRQKI